MACARTRVGPVAERPEIRPDTPCMARAVVYIRFN